MKTKLKKMEAKFGKSKQPYFGDEFVQQVREKFLTELNQDEQNSKNHGPKYDQEDVDRIKNGDQWFIRRHLVESPSTTVLVAVKRIQHTLVWRRKFGVNQL